MKKTLLNKWTIGLLSSAALIVPLTTVACGPSKTVETPGIKPAQTPFTQGTYDLSKLKDFVLANQTTYPELTSTKLAAITPDTLHQYSLGTLDEKNDSYKTLKQADEALLKFAFINNQKPENLKGILDFTKSEALASYIINSGRGPYRTDDTQGIKRYVRSQYLTLRNNDNSVSIVDSEFTTDGVTADSQKAVIDFGKYAEPKKGSRLWDNSFAAPGGLSTASGSATTLSLFRTKVAGEWKSHFDNTTGNVIFDSEQTKTPILTEGLKLSVGDSTKDDKATFASQVKADDAALATALNDATNDRLVFSVDGNQNWSTLSGENVIQSSVAFKGRDLFYGFVRQLYGFKDVRETGKLNGEDTGLKAFTKDELTSIIGQFSDQASYENLYNSGNGYTYGLYNVDIKATVEENTKQGADENKFVLVYKPGSAITPTALNMFIDSAYATPTPSAEIIQARGNATDAEPGKYWGLTNWGNDETITNGNVTKAQPKYTVAPYIFTNYDVKTGTNVGNGIALKRNPYFGGTFNASTNQIETWTTLPTPATDSNAFNQTRLSSFKDNPTQTHEYILDSGVNQDSELIKQAQAYAFRAKPIRTGGIGTWLSYNSLYSTLESKNFNDAGRKMLWGEADASKINGSSAALDYFYGEGSKVRALINSAVNWYTVVQLYFPGQAKEFYSGLVMEDSLKYSGFNSEDARPEFIDSTATLKEIYKNNLSNQETALGTSKFDDASQILDDIATKAGATNSAPAQIPLFRYTASDNPETASTVEANTAILKKLNSLTPKVKFVWKNLGTWSDMVKESSIDQTGLMLFHSFGPDYQGAGTILQQYISGSSTSSVAELFKQALK